MNIYLIAYTKNNLGDDLFTTMLVAKYPQVNFDINIEELEHTQSLKKFKNVNIINTKRELNKIDINKYDAIIYIGGSIFMEKNNGLQRLKDFNKFIKYAKSNNVPFYYISCNFGPYSTKEYIELAKDTFSYCEDVCFRDKYSYENFKEIKNVRYSPDLILSYEIEDIEKKKNTIGISLIDLSIRKDLKDIEKDYLEMLKNNINNYIKDGKEVYLFSFCKYEKDENTIEKIRNMVNNKEKLKIVKYNGNIDDFLKEYTRMEYMLCARFHSMILSAKLKQKVLLLSYSNKIDNVAKDLEFPFSIISFKEINKNIIIDLKEYKMIDEKKLNKIMDMAKLQLEKLNNFIK